MLRNSFGLVVGMSLGAAEGEPLRLSVGLSEGTVLGRMVGSTDRCGVDGVELGTFEGFAVGNALGLTEGCRRHSAVHVS